MNIKKSILDIITEHSASNIAIIYKEKSWTYGDINEKCSWWKKQLIGNIGHGEIIVCNFEENPFEYICQFLSILSVGGIHLSTRDRYTTSARLQLLGRPWSTITSSSNIEDLKVFSSLRTAIDKDDGKVLLKNSLTKPSTYTSGHILETSGSTGEPKWVYWTEEKLIKERLHWINDLSLNSKDSILNLHALDFAHGIHIHILPALFLGIPVVHHNIRTDNIKDIIESIAKYNISMMSALPSHYTNLAINSTNSNLGINVRWALTGGALLSPFTINLVKKNLGFKLKRLYGSTEAGIMCADLSENDQIRPQLRPMNGVEMEIRPLNNISNKFQNIGEPYFKRNYMALEYWGDETRTNSTFCDSWYKTGDAISINKNGSINVLGRAEDVWLDNDTNKLQTAGEISSVISEIQGITEVAVFPPPNQLLTKPTVFCTIDPNIPISILNFNIEEKLAELNVDATIFLGNDWPRTIVGKPARRALLAWTIE